MLVFLFTDIEGSTRLWEEHTGVMTGVIARHDEILRELVNGHGGRITKHTGDGITAVFETGRPLACALQVQVRFAAESWGHIGALPIRAGLHAGEAEFHPSAGTPEGDYFGLPVNCTARVMSAAWGGQILLTPEVTQASALPDQGTLLDLGQHLLKNVSAPQQLYQLDHPLLPRHEFPPPRTLSGLSIRRAVAQRGEEMAGLAPTAMGLRLLAVTLAPALQGELDPESGALEGSLGVLEELGAQSLHRFVAGLARRLRTGERVPTPELELVLEDELAAEWRAGGETALALRADASRLLRAVQGVEAAMAAATEEVKEALVRGLADLGQQFAEFRWMLGGVQEALAEVQAGQRAQVALQLEQAAMQREQLELQREQLAKTDLLVRLQMAGEPVPPWLEGPVRRPAFLEADEGADPYERPVFVAREGELARLEGFLQSALAGKGGVVFVTGGPGRGKTALLHEFAGRAMKAHEGLLVAYGQCNAYSGPGDPYLPFREVLGMLSGEVERLWASGRISGGHARRLWAVVPEVARGLQQSGPHLLGTLVAGEGLLSRVRAAGEEEVWLDALWRAVQQRRLLGEGVEQTHLFQQVTNVLRGLSEGHPLLLVLDDLQWADSASIGLVFHLGRRLGRARILVAGAYRPEELALSPDGTSLGEGERHPLEKVLNELKRHLGEVWVDLGQVAEPEGRAFVDALLATEPNELGEGFREALLAHTGGHPLFTVELLRAMQEPGDLVQDETGLWMEGAALDWGSLPARVEAVIEERIGRLEQELRDVLTVASVEGEDFTAEVVARVQEVSDRKLLHTLSKELERQHRLVREQGCLAVGQKRLSRYKFAHALFQQYVYNDLGEGERNLLHRAIGQVLEDLYEGQLEAMEAIAPQLAYHFAGDAEKERIYARLAGEHAAANFANAEALRYLNRALALTAETDWAERYALLSAREAVHRLQGDRDAQSEDLAILEELADLLDDDERQAEVALGQAVLARETGDYEAALRWATRVIPLAHGAGAARSEAVGYLEWGRVLTRRGDLAGAETRMKQARAMARTAELATLEADSLRGLGNISNLQGNLSEAQAFFEESLDLSRVTGDPHGEFKTLNNLAMVASYQGDYDTARSRFERTLNWFRRIGDRSRESVVLVNLGFTAYSQGDFADARATLKQALGLLREVGNPAGESNVLLNLGAIAAEEGDYGSAKAYYEQTLRLLRGIGEHGGECMALANLAELACQQGDYLGARNLYKETLLLCRERGIRREESFVLAGMGLLYHYLGEDATAREYCDQALLLTRELGLREIEGGALTVLGYALQGLKQIDQAKDTFSQALTIQRELGKPDQAMENLAGLASIALEQGGLDVALAHVEEIVAFLEQGRLRGVSDVRVYLVCYQVLRAAANPRAREVLSTAHALLQNRAATIPDEQLRRAYLENVPHNREILAACAE